MFRYTTHNCDDVDSLGVARIALGGDHLRETVVKATPHVVVAMPYFLVFNAGNPETESLIYVQTTYNESSTLVIWSTKQQAVTKKIASVRYSALRNPIRRRDGVCSLWRLLSG